MSELTLAQRFALWKWLDETVAALRKKELLPQADAEMPPGSRLPAMFGGQLAAWASMPQPAQRAAFVKDGAKLLAWARKQYPGKIEYPAEVKVDAGLIEFLQEHRPESLSTSERVDPQWAADICHGLTDPGYYVTAAGEKLTEVPGIDVPEASPSVPRVNLEPGAAEVIGQAWADGLIDLRGMLALPAPEAPDAG